MKKVLAILTMILWTAAAWAQAPLLGAPRLNGHFTVQQSTVSLLRSSHSVRLQVPLTAGEFGDAELTRFDIWNGTVIERNGAKEKEKVSPPDTVYFRGTLVDNPDSWVFLAVEQHSTHGIVNTGSKQYQFGPTKPDGTDHVAREANLQRPASYKHNYPLVAPVTPEEKAKVTRKVKLTGPVTANVAIETDNELWTKFGSDAATLKYIGDLVGAANVIYNRDVQVTMNIGYVSLWPSSVPDPWKTTTSSAALTELINYWKANRTSVVRANVHQLSGRSLGGGISYLNVLCNTNYGYSVSAVNGSFDVTNPFKIWDVMVFSHETGHIFSSPHSHCYTPPVDQCYNQEPGCYSGPTVCSIGTIMSYCHLCGGIQNVRLVFGSVVSAKVRNGADLATCLTSTVSTTTIIVGSTTTVTTGSSTTTTKPPTTTTSTPVSTTTTTTCRPPHKHCLFSSQCCSKRCKWNFRCAHLTRRGGNVESSIKRENANPKEVA